MDKTNALSWQESLIQTYEELIDQLIAHAPQFAGAIALLIGGLIVSHLLRVISRKLVRSFDSLFRRAAITDGARQEKMKSSYAVIISKVVFWTAMTFFIAATANMLDWQLFSRWMESVINYLPNLITGVLIILAGFLLSSGARAGVMSAAHSAGVEQSHMLARVAQLVILFTTLVVGIEQIGINVHFLSDVLVVILGVVLAGGALAFGLGARTLVANVIGAQYVRKHCRIGEQMKMQGIEGSVVEVTQTSIVLDTDSGRTVVPAAHFQEQVSSFFSNSDDSARSEALSSKKEGEE